MSARPDWKEIVQLIPAGTKVLDLAHVKTGTSKTLKEIAAQQAISDKYLWQVISSLTSDGLVLALRGSQGGYRLAVTPHHITLKDIVLALEGPCEWVSASRIEDNRGRIEFAVEYEVWRRLEKCILEHLGNTSLKDIRAFISKTGVGWNRRRDRESEADAGERYLSTVLFEGIG
ncbi:MAG: Rrf2 family transcriptional regulator [Lentisphaerota bacterium]